MKKFTDEQIIKALECCKENSDCENCRNCTGYASYGNSFLENIIKEVLDLINRLKAQNKEFDEKIIMQMGLIEHQKAEIERYKKTEKFIYEKCNSILEEAKKIPHALKRDIAKAKSEAYNEFADKLVGAFNKDINLYGRVTVYDVALKINTTLKKLMEGGNEPPKNDFKE